MEVKGNKIEFNNLLFQILDDNGNLKIEHLLGADAFIIDSRDPDFARYMLKKIRSHHEAEFYLKPIFLINYKESKDPVLSNLHDGILFSYDQLKEASETVKQIFLRTSHLNNQIISSYEAQVIKKVLDYLYTRNSRALKPYIDSRSITGYTFPELSMSFDKDEEFQVFDLLEWADKEGLIWPDFLEKVYLCNNCSSGFLSYREVCPHCNSSNSRAEDLVHHFPCAYVGPLSDFQNSFDTSLTCPKCNKALRHIGVDYDKPSIIHHCNNCDMNFQDVFIKAKCISCEHDTEVQYLKSKNVNVYKLTKKGRAAATNGIVFSNQEVEAIFGTVSMDVLKTMLHYELERIKENPLQKSTLALIHFENIFELYNKIGEKAQKELLEDLAVVLRENIKPTDFMAFESTSTLYLVLINSDVVKAAEMLKDIQAIIENLMKTNFNEFMIKLYTKERPLEAVAKAEFHLRELAKGVFA